MPIILNTGGYGQSNVAVPQTTGFVNMATFSNFSAESGVAFYSVPSFAATSNGQYAGLFTVSTTFMRVLGCQNLNTAALPLGAIINGVTIRYSGVTFLGNAIETFARLIVGGVTVGASRNASQFYPPFPSGFNFVRGGAADLWGTTLTAAQVNASNFGVGVSFGMGSGWTAAGIDHLQMKIDYTA